MTRDTDIERIADALIDVHSGTAPWPGPMTSTQFATRLYDAGLRPSVEPAGLNAVYAERNLVVQAYADAMESLSYHVAWGVDPSEPDWPVLYIETPNGQVSWHIPKAERIYEPEDRTASFGPVEWDGHTDEEKYDRLRRYLLPTQASDSPEKP